MNIRDVKKILSDTAYVRVSGSAEEHACAEYLVAQCAKMGLQARVEPFDVVILDSQGNDVTGNYDISYVFGTLKYN